MGNYIKNGGGLCSEYNIRLTTIKAECLSEYIAAIHKMQKQVFKLNVGFGFILRHIETNEFKYFYACRNNFQMMPTSPVVRTEEDLSEVYKNLDKADILE